MQPSASPLSMPRFGLQTRHAASEQTVAASVFWWATRRTLPAFTHWTARGPGHRALANAVVIDVLTRRSRSEFEGSASLANAHRCQAVTSRVDVLRYPETLREIARPVRSVF